MTPSKLFIIAGAALLSTSASAADLGWGGAAAPVTDMFSPTSASNWSGFYAGVNGGYGFGDITSSSDSDVDDEGSGGAVLGGQVGYNVDFGGFVLGGEADLQWANISRDYSDDKTDFNTSLDMFGTARIRAGATFGPVMPFVTAGFAGGRASVNYAPTSTSTNTESMNHWGWTAGAGMEAAVTDQISLKAEFLHVNLGEQEYLTSDQTVGHSFNVIRAGLNYRF